MKEVLHFWFSFFEFCFIELLVPLNFLLVLIFLQTASEFIATKEVK